MAGGSCGRGSLRSEATGALSVLSAPGQRWERLGARSRGCGGGTLVSEAARSRARRGGAERDPSLGIPHPCALGAAGLRGLHQLAGRRWFGGSAQPPVWVVSQRTKQQGPSSTTRAHTHLLATSSAHSGASSSLRAPRGPDHGALHTHAYIHTYVRTDIPPAHQRPLGHRH